MPCGKPKEDLEKHTMDKEILSWNGMEIISKDTWVYTKIFFCRMKTYSKGVRRQNYNTKQKCKHNKQQETDPNIPENKVSYTKTKRKVGEEEKHWNLWQ